jgi:gamma-glutamyltranspeptidase/glutathione hydrolase
MQFTARSGRGMVVSPHHLASQAGLDVLKDGGDAVAAAVAVAACLAVVYPHMTGIGGDGFWLIAEPDGRTHAIDACGRSAAKAELALYAGLRAIPWRGPLAANTVAGTISGWVAALETGSGALPLARLLRDAIHYADTGTFVTRNWEAVAPTAGVRGQPGAYADIFEPQGRPLREGDRVVQRALASTLRQLADEGLDSFYRGHLAEIVAADLATLGSPLTVEDFHDHVALRPEPLSISLAGAQLFNTAPPTQGLASLLILALFERLGLERGSPEGSFAHIHGLVEATKQAFLIRDAHVGDPACMTLNPQALLDDVAALDSMAARIDLRRALPWPQPPSGGDTTWFAAIDDKGRAASVIQSIYFEFGSGVVLPRTGIVWQNRGASFRLAENGWNALKPRRKPFHTLNPALARFEDGRVMAYGTMGGEGQPQTQAAVFTRYARFGMPLQQAITAPRWLLGRAWGDPSTTLKLEDRFDPALYAELRAAGHAVELVAPFETMMGHAGAIVRHPGGALEGASDPRSDGGVAAW